MQEFGFHMKVMSLDLSLSSFSENTPACVSGEMDRIRVLLKAEQ